MIFRSRPFFLCVVCFLISASHSAFGAGTQTLKLLKGHKRIGSVELSLRESKPGFETTTRVYTGATQTTIRCNVDEKWNLLNVTVQNSLAHKLLWHSEAKSNGKRISTELVDAKEKKTRSEFGVQDVIIPKTALYHYFTTIKNPEVNVPHEIQMFDEMTLTLQEERWTYLGPRLNGMRKIAHDFEVKGEQNLIVTLSDNKKLRRIRDIKNGTEIRARGFKKK